MNAGLVLISSASLMAHVGLASAGGDSQLVNVLRARVEACSSFQADVQVTESVPPGRKALGAAMVDFAAWQKKNRPQSNPKGLEERGLEYTRHQGARTRHYRYWTQGPALIRLEEYLSPAERGAGEQQPDILIYKVDRWKIHVPVASRTGNVRNDQLAVQDAYQPPPIDGARGQGLLYSVVSGELLKPSRHAHAIAHISWNEFFQLLAPGDARDLMEPLPDGGPARPVLEVVTAPLQGTGKKQLRVRFWFDDEHGLCPLRLELAYLNAHQTDFLLDAVAEWSEPRLLGDGSWMPHRCVIGRYHPFRVVREGADESTMPFQSFEVKREDIRFSNVRVNEPIDPSLFEVNLRQPTEVADLVEGEAYLVGSAGEVLRRSAIETRSFLPPQETPATSAWWKVAVLGAGFLALAAAALVFYLRRRALARRAT